MNGPERQDKTAVLLGLAILVLPLLVWSLWATEFSRHATPEDRSSAFFGHFPPFARREGLLTLSTLLVSGVAGFVLVRGALSSRGVLRLLAVVGVFVALALCFWNAWQLL
jgi:hypothetical protein